MTAYQLAIGLERMHPEVREALGQPLGGLGAGARNSMAQYLAKRLSDRIRDNPGTYFVEGAFLSPQYIESLQFESPAGHIEASSPDAGWDLSRFRLRTDEATRV
ncbi:MAG TPA: hypothetical protein VFT74_20445 [Isosphaeraceae bacterium]|nr:hypothetical protein [Isosphaeraceae bacterium]